LPAAILKRGSKRSKKLKRSAAVEEGPHQFEEEGDMIRLRLS
jgi:hypothetical protein